MKGIFVTLGFTSLLISGCSSETVRHKTLVQRVDPASTLDTDITFSAEDLHQSVEKMVSSMLRSKIFHKKVVIDVWDVENATDEHVDTRAITDSIKTTIIKSGKAVFIGSRMREALQKELAYQNKNPYSDKKHARKIGKQFGADYILKGRLVSIKQRNSQLEDFYYKLTLELQSVETGAIVWIEEKKFRKKRAVGEF